MDALGYEADTGSTVEEKINTGYGKEYTYTKSKQIGSLTVSYTYDDNGNQLTVTDSTGTIERTYDELNRVLTKTVSNIGTVNYTYDIITSGVVEDGFVAEKTVDPKNNITVKIFDKTGRLK